MKILLLMMTAVLLFPACVNREREKQLDAREVELNEKEQQLLLREKTIGFREQEINEMMRVADSIRKKDSTTLIVDTVPNNPALVGNWSVKMTCVETSCAGSAIGDVKTEQWNLSYAGNHLVAKASDHGNLVRTYSGIYQPGKIELIEHRDSTMVYDTRMVVRLQLVNDQRIEGQREIIREKDCRIIYALTLDKMNQP